MFEFHISNGNGNLGLAARFFGYTLLKDKSRLATMGKSRKNEIENTTKIHKYLPYGESLIYFKDKEIKVDIVKDGNITDELVFKNLYPYYLTFFIDTDAEEGEKLIEEYLKTAVKYFEDQIKENDKEPGKILTYIYDDYWSKLSKRKKRKLNTIHLEGKGEKLLEELQNFRSEKTKKFYEEKGIPYKYNILLEGHPGSGKTSLIFTLASELNMDIAILNFNKDVDDNSLMSALLKLPKKCILVLEDIDVLFKERKENDNYKSMISFSGLLNSLDGMAFKEDLITIMTTNYECNLDAALKRPGRIDKAINFGFAKEGQISSMFYKFYPDETDIYKEFYSLIKGLNFTTAMLQQYFLWHMYSPDNLIEDLDEFNNLCSKHNYKKKLDLYM
tara:strand:+ start:2902 stop:4065 length:1164 start_codon:yes stop_codon:yes gene_type:complete